MRVLHEKPPEWIMSGCMNAFRVNVDRTVWTYGDIIYCPGEWEPPDHLIAHESTHSKQQQLYPGGKDAWWKEYLVNAAFRAEQEVAAYAVQYHFFCGHIRDRNRRALFLNEIASSFAGPLYQLALSKPEAVAGIREIAGAI